MNKKEKDRVKSAMNYWEHGFRQGCKAMIDVIDNELIIPERLKNRFKREMDENIKEVIRLEKLDQLIKNQ